MQSGFVKFGVLAVTGLSLVAAGIFLGREIDIDAEPEPMPGRQSYFYVQPDAQLLRDARDGLQSFHMRNIPLGPRDLRLEEDVEAGLIQTAWFPVHKGEAEQKVQIAVWGSLYRVDVWTRSVLTGKLGKDGRSQGAERDIQASIEALRHSRGAAVSSPAPLAPTAPPRTNYARETSSSSTRGSAAGR